MAMPKISCPSCDCAFEPVEMLGRPRLLADVFEAFATEYEMANDRLISLNAELEARVLQSVRQLKDRIRDREQKLEQLGSQLRDCEGQIQQKDFQIHDLHKRIKALEATG